MWIWQLIIRRAKKVTIPLTDENCTPFNQIRYAIQEIFSTVEVLDPSQHFHIDGW